ncbi:hypothetical protein ACFQLX_13650 [Streptomyces polyrhachis]|uniref:TetR family transcriptional regulator n=1 Tax=Streptomyces polyrhachis TaxID=1282885 RepID=A0ABW2GER2_9ACTN
MVVRPLVLGPDNVPVVENERQAAQDVPLAVFSAITHSKGEAAPAILEAVAAALGTLDPDTAVIFAEYVEAGLPEGAARSRWRALMSTLGYFFRSEAAEQVREEGREQGAVRQAARTVLNILDHRGIEVPEAARARILGCTDIGLLELWSLRALSAPDAEALFTPDAGDAGAPRAGDGG